MAITFRPALLTDIAPMHRVRLAVRENPLNNPLLVTPADYAAILTGRGAGWVAEEAGEVVGFAIVDAVARNVWALFVDPVFEQRGIGRELFRQVVAWATAQHLPHLWLSTAPGTRAEGFYAAAGWTRTRLTAGGEVQFEWWPAG